MTILLQYADYVNEADFFEIAAAGHTLLRPYDDKNIGLTEIEIDFTCNRLVEEISQELSTSTEEDLEDNPSNSLIDMISPPSQNQHDPQVEIDGSYVFKATIVKSLFSSDPMSKDRLRRVRGLTKFTDDCPRTMADKFLMIGDPLLAKDKGKILLTKISSINQGGRKVKSVGIDNMNDENVSFTVREISVHEVDDYFTWKGQLKDTEITVPGSGCYAVSPDLKEIDGKMLFAFDKQLISDLGVKLDEQWSVHKNNPEDTQEMSASSSSSSSVKPDNQAADKLCKCKICTKNIKISKMREHVGQHIMQGKIKGAHLCGFCGLDTCIYGLEKTSKSNGVQHYKVTSTCTYFWAWGRAPSKVTCRNKCTNHVVHCKHCTARTAIWTYNAPHHYEAEHPDVDCPYLQTEEEKVYAPFRLL